MHPLDAHRFVATRAPTPHELHSLVTRLTNKQPIDVRVERDGRIVTLVCASNALTPKSIPLQSNQFEYKRTAPREGFVVHDGDEVSLSVALCYTVNMTQGPRRTIAPFTVLGRIKREVKLQFLRYLEEKTGLHLYNLDAKGAPQEVANITIRPHGIDEGGLDVHGNERDVRFIGAADMFIGSARVKDASRFNELAVRAIGNRRTYGFGTVYLASVRSTRAPEGDDYADAEEVIASGETCAVASMPLLMRAPVSSIVVPTPTRTAACQLSLF